METKKFKQFINPHQHSDGSNDGAATVDQIVARNVELGATHVAITEHGNLNTGMALYMACKKRKVKPILGIELYVKSPFEDYTRARAQIQYASEPDAKKRENKIERKVKEEYLHLTVHFKDEWAYQYFCKLTPKMEEQAVTRWGERKPVCTIDQLRGAAGHITIGTGCISGMVQRFMLPDKNAEDSSPMMAEKAYKLLREIAGQGNFFVEVFPYVVNRDWVRPVVDKGVVKEPGKIVDKPRTVFFPDGDIQKVGNRTVVELARKYNDPILISLDAHFATAEQKVIQDSKLGRGTGQQRYANSFHIMTTDEAAEVLRATLAANDAEIAKWVENSYKFASLFDKFKLTTKDDRWVIQKAPDDFMIRVKTMIDRHGRMDWKDPVMGKRLKEEMQVLFFNGKINLFPYFEVVEDIAHFCRKNHVLMNVRGSAGGCFLLYLIGVSGLNPILFNLPFERFLTLGRIIAGTLPDVDIDISHQDVVFAYLEKKYGEAFCRISTDTMLKLKSSIKDAERLVFGDVTKETEKFTKKLPQTPQNTNDKDFVFGFDNEEGHHAGLMETDAELQKYANDNPAIWKIVTEMMGVMRQKGTHACGIVIADKPIQEYVPIMYIDDTRLTGFSPKSIEECGLIKFDILGLNTLKDIQLCLDSVEERLGLKIDPWHLPYDQRVFAEFCKGNTETVFQFDTTTSRPFTKEIMPLNVNDLSNITALVRPGTLEAPYGDGRTLAKVFVDRRKGETIEYIHPELIPIVEETMGIQLYQEQTLRIFRDLANYSFEQAETVRRGIGKKDKKVLESCYGDLKKACLSRGWTEQQIDLLIQQIGASARYSFNKAHSASYANVAYACMWLKVNYRLDWWKATLSNSDKDEMVNKFWRYVHRMVANPDINQAKPDYVISGNQLIPPLSIISKVGEKAYAQLIAGAPYANLESFIKTHLTKKTKDEARHAVNSGTVRRLIIAGVMDTFFPPNTDLDQKLHTFEDIKAEVRKEKKVGIPVEYVALSDLDRYMFKKKVIGIHSLDLRDLIIPKCQLKGHKETDPSGMKVWVTDTGGYRIYDWDMIEAVRENIERSSIFDGTYYAIAYVVDERAFRYKGNKKQATELTLDINGHFSKEVIWPSKDEEAAPYGFCDFPVLVEYWAGKGKLRLNKVLKLLKEKDVERYNVIS